MGYDPRFGMFRDDDGRFVGPDTWQSCLLFVVMVAAITGLFLLAIKLVS